MKKRLLRFPDRLSGRVLRQVPRRRRENAKAESSADNLLCPAALPSGPVGIVIPGHPDPTDKTGVTVGHAGFTFFSALDRSERASPAERSAKTDLFI